MKIGYRVQDEDAGLALRGDEEAEQGLVPLAVVVQVDVADAPWRRKRSERETQGLLIMIHYATPLFIVCFDCSQPRTQLDIMQQRTASYTYCGEKKTNHGVQHEHRFYENNADMLDHQCRCSSRPP